MRKIRLGEQKGTALGMRSLTVGLVVDDSLDSADGVQQQVLTLGAWLKRQGHEVHYLAGETTRSDLPNTHSLAKNVRVRFNQNSLSMPLPAARRPIRSLLAEAKFDILHIQMPFSPWLAGRIVRAAHPGTAVVGTFHDLPASPFVSLATRALGFWLRGALSRFDAVCSVSEPADEYMKKVFRLSGTVIPNAVDLRHFSKYERPKSEEKIKKIVFLGRLVKRKGAEHLIRSFAGMNDRGDVRLVLGGRGSLQPKLEQLAAALGVADSVEFAGFIREADKAAFLGSAEIAVFPSTGGESFGIVLIEAMAAGAGVVVGGDNPGYRSVLAGRAEVIVDPTRTAEFSQRLQTLLNDGALQRDLHGWQQQLVRQFDIEMVGPRIVSMYHEALRKRR